MSIRAQLYDALRRSRRALLAAAHDLPEPLWYVPAAVGPWSVAEWFAIRIEAENRALTVVHSLHHGRPFLYDLPEAELDAHAVARRRGWSRDHLLRELYQQREETMITLAALTDEALARSYTVGDRVLSPLAVLMAVVAAEDELAARLRAWHTAHPPAGCEPAGG
ncbi:MAG: hypothetical protein RMN24_12410 [Anaerolineae bacterium]|nr:hypothetical protein [Caldilineales bacterium]MCX7851193.1 hypothetical protein [Caldilineales bacterium]MDW8269957.1 hypothetical protein [Anaerolineae bacterium]